ncbi:MAG TPA: hypothetical protein VMD05_01005 [Candidatus Nanoarchaeia archaeon]|nr:hypothetical protein [Candidatus Nanoarchaeia archaeon]
MSNAYVIHTDFDEIITEVAKLQEVDKETVESITIFVGRLQDMAYKVEPVIKRESHEDERQLWEEYRQLQQQKLVLLDLTHEYEGFQKNLKELNPQLDFLIKDALEELKDHIGVSVETHRAHIDILEIYNTRRIEVLALVITSVISYLAVWEFFVRDLLLSIVFPSGLSPGLNYVLVLITLVPVFSAVVWAWANRGKRF